ncbi:hypothetical protein FisN_2Lu385 [Fistulifera solaris]|uniref:Reverse transcriptase Ty1/copia-type domain-containing protein n=1 Tax=Fistulifera solaris TaxID=1519565 RepID=A0A1Z5JPD2_FISSO|nr:hypothetical protein FisN_2Lu385 [Fistulifera solaris]|eukprot:GAX15903.1 hypothetical protein FisN_2Lu385 [Fistulifera solaris]
MFEKGIDFQLTPAGVHRRNAAERAIRTFKNHFIAGMCSTDPNFPMQLWDTLLPQAQLTLNLLRSSHINPKLSAHAQIFGAFDLNRTPLAPPGTRVIIHDKPQNRASWAPHGSPGWYVGHAPEHYRCYTCRTTANFAERISDTVVFFPHRTPLPEMSPHEKLTQATVALTQALQHLQLTNGTNKLPTAHDFPRVSSTHTQPAPRVHTANTLLPSQHIPDTPLVNLFIQEECTQRHYPTHYANSVFDATTGKHLEYRDLIRLPHTKQSWLKSAANEFGRLAQGLKSRKIHGTDTITFISKSRVPNGRKVTYARFVCTLRPQKAEEERTRLTVGGNLIEYNGPTNAPTADITTYKVLINNTLSTPNARQVIADIKNYYLGTNLPISEYMKIHILLIPNEIIDEYNLHELQDESGFIYIEINKGMYGLPQSGRLANEKLARTLAPYGYYQARHTPGLWLHKTLPILFVLVVDDFAIQYTNKEHAKQLLHILKTNYEDVTIDWTASLYIGITVKWDYETHTATLSMPGYISKLLDKHHHPTPVKPCHAPHPYNIPQYGVKQQLTPAPDTSESLNKAGILRIQQIVGSLLYYSRAVDPTIAVTLSALASEQSKATQNTNKKVHQLLDYCATYPVSHLRYHASDMILKIHSDASFGNESGFRSRAGGHHYLGKANSNFFNSAILNPTGILRHVVTSATEAEIGALFVNAKEGLILRTTLHEMGFSQPCTTIITDNTMADGFVNDTIKKQRSRAIDMRFHWIIDQRQQNIFDLEWRPSNENKGDYFTKHHSPAHHRLMRPVYLHCQDDRDS